MKKIFGTFFAFLILGGAIELSVLALTKATGWNGVENGRPLIAAVHVHLIALGGLFFLVQVALEKLFRLTESKLYKPFYGLFLAGMAVTVSAMYYKGVCQLYGASVIRGITEGGAAIGHSLLLASLILFALCLYFRAVKEPKTQD